MTAVHTQTSGARVQELAQRVVDEYPLAENSPRDVLGARFDHGLAWVGFPEGLGGLGAHPGVQGVADAVFDAAGAPDPRQVNVVGFGLAAHTIVEHGSAELAHRLLRPLYVGDEIWCQLFSEPSAGSDLAGLATSAVRDGDGWRVNGHKVWTTRGHEARWALLLARTDPSLPKHRGLTLFVADMSAPGVEVRPLRQMTGDAEFNEVELHDVHVSDDHRLGEVGSGWAVAMTTLANERNVVADSTPGRASGAIGAALRLWRERPQARTPHLRDRLVSLCLRADAVRLTCVRYATGRDVAGPEGSMAKISVAALDQSIYEFCMDLLGPEGSSFQSYAGIDPHVRDSVGWRLLRARAASIEGGTSEVLRNVVAERLLGLPGDVRMDKGVPWRDLPKG